MKVIKRDGTKESYNSNKIEKAVEKAMFATYKFMEPKMLSEPYRDWETDRKSTRLNSSHSAKSRMPSSA